MGSPAEAIASYAITTMIILWLLTTVAKRNTFYRKILNQPRQKHISIDGIRGFLALAVVFHHANLTQNHINGGGWRGTDEFSSFLGRAGVACFFMITAFLFWEKISKSSAIFDTRKFYISRILRIGPMYIFSIFLVLFTVAMESGGELRVPVKDLLAQTTSWIFFGVNGFPDINLLKETKLIAAGVYWTMTQEVAFYLLLPLLGAFSRNSTALAIAAVCAALIFWASKTGGMVAYFAAGIAVAKWREPLANIRGRYPLAAEIVAAASLLLAFHQFRGENLGPSGAFFLMLFFACIATGCSMAGILKSRASHTLGTISFSLYLVHGIVLFHIRNLETTRLPDIPLVSYLDLISAILSVGISLVTYRLVEHPFLQRGQVHRH